MHLIQRSTIVSRRKSAVTQVLASIPHSGQFIVPFTFRYASCIAFFSHLELPFDFKTRSQPVARVALAPVACWNAGGGEVHVLHAHRIAHVTSWGVRQQQHQRTAEQVAHAWLRIWMFQCYAIFMLKSILFCYFDVVYRMELVRVPRPLFVWIWNEKSKHRCACAPKQQPRRRCCVRFGLWLLFSSIPFLWIFFFSIGIIYHVYRVLELLLLLFWF